MNNIEIQKLEEKFTQINSEVSSLQGQCSLLGEQSEQLNIKLSDLKHKQEIYRKAIELLTLVQKTTEERIKSAFESIVSYALQFIYSQDYQFKLEFNRRGNLGGIDFNIITPQFQEPADPTDTSGGGILDILSLALRIALLELSRPKIEGTLIFDESFKHLSANYLPKAEQFLEALNRKLGRQIILITHQTELMNESNNIIRITK